MLCATVQPSNVLFDMLLVLATSVINLYLWIMKPKRFRDHTLQVNGLVEGYLVNICKVAR